MFSSDRGWVIGLAALASMLPSAGPGYADQGAPALTREAAASALAERDRLCQRDGGRLWGISLCGPMILVDPATRAYVATTGTNLVTGTLPPTIVIANTAVDWDGKRWSMAVWPLPAEAWMRDTLLMHESWHRIQNRLGLPATDTAEDHLATLDGRITLRLELRALAAALEAKDPRSAIADALAFRAWRDRLFPDAAAHEDRLERHEGLAEYTGRRLSGDTAVTPHLIESLRKADAKPSFVRSFAYFTGPAYGLLLDRAAPDWRKRLGAGQGLAQLLAHAEHVEPRDLSAAAIEARGARYGLVEIRAQEQAAAKALADAQAGWRGRLVAGPVLVVPADGANVNFNPNNLVPLPGEGTVYPTMKITGAWGSLDVRHDALLASDWSTAKVALAAAPAPGAHVETEDWTLDLAPGWAIGPGSRPGDFAIVKAAP